MIPVTEYKGKVVPDWCPGCGNFSQLRAISMALSQLDIKPEDVVISSGIGCSSNMPEFINTYGFHGLHGRSLPVAEGIKWANRKLTVIAYGGDGDGYFEGTQHFYHAAKRNVDMTYMVSDNQVFGLTTGQASPTTPIGRITKSTPDGNIEPPFNPMHYALTAGATFVARGLSGDIKQLTEITKAAIQHKGFSFIDVFSPCVTYNKIEGYDFFRKTTYELQNNNRKDFFEAFKHASEWGEDAHTIPIGIFYDVEAPVYEDVDETLSKYNLKEKEPYKLTEADLEEFY